MQTNKIYRWAILLFSIATLFLLSCGQDSPTGAITGLEDSSVSSLAKNSNGTTPIALARADNPLDFVPDFLGDIVTVQGVITSPNILPEAGAYHFIQDNSAAMQVFAWASISPPVLEMGDEVVVTGVIKQFRGSTYIEPQSASDLQIVGTGTLRKPKKIHAKHLADQVGEKIEGELVVMENVRIVDGEQFPDEGYNRLIRVVDSKGDTALVWIDKDSDIDGSTAPSGLFNLTGNATQYSYDTPADNLYELQPRGLFDIN